MTSSEPRISEEEMQYYQFKARQMFLLRKEDHEWNQFCKRNTCTCCLCNPTSHEVMKNVGLQTPPTNVQRVLRRNFISTTSENKNLPNAFTEIRDKLNKLDLSLSKVLTFQNKEVQDLQVPSKLTSTKSSGASVKTAGKDERLDIINNVLKGSLLRLQSAATWKESSLAQSQKSGFMLPRDLQNQRIIARRAYLASLEKLKNKSETIRVNKLNSKKISTRERLPEKPIPKKTKPSSLKLYRDKNNHIKRHSLPQERKQSTESNLVTAVESNEIMDENIESAIDVMIDDLIGETALSVHKIKHMKTLKKSENHCIKVTEGKTQVTSKRNHEKTCSSHWGKIRNNLPHLISKMDSNKDTSTQTSCGSELTSKLPDQHQTLLQNTNVPIAINPSIPLKRTKLYINNNSANEISKQRKEYWKYLENISRTRKGNFNPWTLSNMVAESLLDDCIQDVTQELQDIPSDLIMGLYNQEFLISLTDTRG